MLNPRQTRFVQEYAKDFNGAQAAIRAGYSERGARVTASKLLTHPNISTEIANLSAKATAKSEMDAEWVRERVKRIIENNESEQPMVSLKGLEMASRYNGMFQDDRAAGMQAFQILINLGDSRWHRQPAESSDTAAGTAHRRSGRAAG